MSALDEYLNDEKYEPELYDADGWKLLDQARAELAQLRASAEAERYWQETAEQERCNAAEQRERAEKLRATVAEQARQLAEARKAMTDSIGFERSE